MRKVVEALNCRWDDRLHVDIRCVGISAALYIPAFRRAASRSVGAMRDCNEYRPGGQSPAPAFRVHVTSRCRRLTPKLARIGQSRILPIQVGPHLRNFAKDPSRRISSEPGGILE